jgi:large subunit ribosomal protein L22
MAIAKAKFVRYSARKVGQVLGQIRGKPVLEAFRILKFVPRSAKEVVEKTLKSAVANEGRLKQQSGLYVKECYVCLGPSLKRFRSRAFGRAYGYKRKSCHITIIVGEMPKKQKKETAAKSA